MDPTAAPEIRAPKRSDWLQDATSMLVSAACHLTAFIVLGLFAVGGSRGLQGNSITVDLGSGGTKSPTVDTASLDDGPATSQPAAEGGGTSLADSVRPDVSSDVTTALAPESGIDIAAPVAVADSDLSIFSTGATALSGPTGRLASKSGRHGRGGGGTGDGSSSKASTAFFGIGGYGQTFVYVVDCSDSMNDHEKFERARYELLKSIEQLGQDQKYFVIFYNQRAYPMESDKPLAATQENFAKTTEWVNQAEAEGGTNPLPALVMALSLEPDAIYFLTDGQFDPIVTQELRIRNRQNLKQHTRVIPIHTIAFFDRNAEGLMRTIARNSGGEYKLVN